MRVAAIQLHVSEDEEPRQRVEHAARLIADEGRRGADLVLLPEMWVPGYFAFDGYVEVAEPLDGPTVSGLRQTAAKAGVNLLAGSLVERSDEGLHNTSVLISRDGELLASYRKVHLFPYGSREHEVLTRGDRTAVANVDGLRVGLSTCYDLRFPELYRAMVDEGAEAFLVVAGWPVPRIDAWRTLGRARAIENQATVVACNTSGRQGGATFLGASYAYDAWGTPLGELDDRPGVLRIDVDADAIRAARKDFPALSSRVFGTDTR